MSVPFYDFQSSLGFLTITANRLLSAYFRKRLVEAGLDVTAEQWGVLAHLWNEGKTAQDELAAIVCVDKSSLSRVLDVMERRGLVRRERDPGDARRRVLYATPLADEFKEPCREVAEATMETVLKDIPPEELKVCLKVLSRLKVILKDISE